MRIQLPNFSRAAIQYRGDQGCASLCLRAPASVTLLSISLSLLLSFPPLSLRFVMAALGRRIAALTVVCACLPLLALALDNGQGLTPAMGCVDGEINVNQ